MFKKEDWHTCNICNKKIKELADIYQKKYNKQHRANYNIVFQDHIIKDHKITLDDYFQVNKIAPICPCGICNRYLTIVLDKKTSSFKYSEMSCGRNKGVLKWSLEAKNTRIGKNNPMYGKTPWNKNKNKKTNKSLKTISDKHLGKIVSRETKLKQSNAAKKRLIHGHTGHKHSEKAKEKMRQNTLRLIKEGFFKQLKSKCFIEFGLILNNLNIKYETEYIYDIWSFDYYLPDYNIFIEVDGDYFHSNPKFFPSGPKTNTQKINYYRDIKKNKYCIDNNLKMYRFWENDILNFKDSIICNLKKLLVLDK